MNSDFVITKRLQDNSLLFWNGKGGWANQGKEAHIYQTRESVEKGIKRNGWQDNVRIGYMTMEDVKELESLTVEAPMVEDKEVKHTMKRVPDGCGGFIAQRYEYRGYEIYKKDTYSWGIMGYVGYYNSRGEVVEYIDKRIASRDAKKELA